MVETGLGVRLDLHSTIICYAKRMWAGNSML